MSAAFDRVAGVVGGAVVAALRERGARRMALLDDGGPEAELAARILAAAGLSGDAVARVRGSEPGPGRAAEERRRYEARLLEDALPAHPASKTVLLLGGELPPEPLLPLGDLWATEVGALAGGWSAPPEVAALAEAAGGIEALDDALRRLVDRRDPGALGTLPAEAGEAVRRRLAAGAPSRRWPRLVPKLGVRTLCADLFE